MAENLAAPFDGRERRGGKAAGQDRPPSDAKLGEASNADEEKANQPRDVEDDTLRGIQEAGSQWGQSVVSGRYLEEVISRLSNVSGGITTAHVINNTTIHRGTFHGSVDIGTAKGAGTVPGQRSREVSPRDLELARGGHFVPPPWFAAAKRAVQERRLVLLHGPTGTGKWAASCGLAYVLAPDRVLHLRPSNLRTGMREVTDDDKGAAFVVFELDQRIADGWDAYSLVEVCDRLEALGSYLIVTVDSQVSLGSHLLREDGPLIECEGCADALLVARKHGLREMNEAVGATSATRAGSTSPAETTREAAASRFTDYLDREDVVRVVKSRPEPRSAAEAGRILAKTAWEDGDVATTLQHLQDPDAEVRKWFGTHTENADRTLATAVAALEGASYLSVADAAGQLLKALVRYKYAWMAQPVFRSLLTDGSWFELVQVPQDSGFGRLPTETIRFRSELTQLAVLRYVWHELDGLRQAMVPWLTQLGGHPDASVRARAAAAAGILALFDFQYALDNVLHAWAASSDDEQRECAAVAFSVPGADGRYANQAWRLLENWCIEGMQGGAHELLQTAVAAFGGPFGARWPEAALSYLRMVADKAGQREWPRIAYSLGQLMAHGLQAGVLSTLTQWTDGAQSSEGLVFAGLRCFLFCTTAWWHEPPFPPILLRLGSSHRAEVARLWGRALDNKNTRADALEKLREWFGFRDQTDPGNKNVIPMVRQIATLTARQRQRLEYHCDKWATDKSQPSKTARHALTVLNDMYLKKVAP